MGTGPFSWLRPFRHRSEKGQQPQARSHPPSPGAYYTFNDNRPSSDQEMHASTSSNSSTVPYHNPSPATLSSPSLFAADIPPIPAHPARHHHLRTKNSRRSRRINHHSNPPPSHTNTWLANDDPPPTPAPTTPFGFAASAYSDPKRVLAVPTSPVDYGSRSADFERLSRMPQASYEESHYPGDVSPNSVGHSAFHVSAPLAQADHYSPQRPMDRNDHLPRSYQPMSAPYGLVPEFRVSATTPEVSSMDGASVGSASGLSALRSSSIPDGEQHQSVGRYSKKLGDAPNRFIFRRRTAAPATDGISTRARGQPTPSPTPPLASAHAPPVHVEDEYFGSSQHDDRDRNADMRQGEEVLLRFLRNALGPKAQNLAVRLMNKTPITSSASFSYVIHQATEDSDLDIIRRDLTSGRLYTSGVRLLGGGWCNLLLGDRFAPGSNSRQRHELTYRRSSCSCILCRVRTMEMVKEQCHAEAQSRGHSEFGESDVESTGISADVLSTMSSRTRTPTHSAMANFVVRCSLPSNSALMSIGASSSSRELEIGTVVRLNYRASAKLKFTEDVRELFGHFAYTGPISHEEVYRRVTTIGVHYYLYNKGKKERKVYIQGELIRLPVQVGVVKLGTQPMYMPELGATFCIHRKQIMSIYVGEIVLEGNSLGSFIKTGIRYYIGFGEERGVCPVYPNKTLGKARKLGINELLLHHHMVDDLEVRCL